MTAIGDLLTTIKEDIESISKQINEIRKNHEYWIVRNDNITIPEEQEMLDVVSTMQQYSSQRRQEQKQV